MPEVCEIIYTTQYLLTKLKGRYLVSMKIISGRYTHENLSGKNLINKYSPLKIKNIDNKGKFMWFELLNEKQNKIIYMLNTFGLTGHWGFKKNDSSRVQFNIENKDGTKKYNLYYTDARNFGTLKITDDINDLNTKLNKIGRDLLKTEFTDKDFAKWIKDFKYQDTKIIKILMTQEKNKGLGSGLGNYLAPEILYHAKISPHRILNSLSNKEIKKLSHSIKYILKLCYTNNKIGYMENFKDFIEKHKEKVISGKYPDYHKNINVTGKEFEFAVYRKKEDPLGNKVIIDKIIGDRSTYWVPTVQK